MALLKFNNKTLSLDLLVGIKEKYTPTKKILQVNDELELLKNNVGEFVKNTWGEKTQQELFTLFKNSDNDRDKWVEYMTNEYSPKLDKLIKDIHEINKKICKGYKEKLEEKSSN